MNHDATFRYKNFLRALVSEFVEHGDLLEVTGRERGGNVQLFIKPAPTDFGKVLGKQRNTLTALEVLLCHMAALDGDRIQLKLVEPGNRVPGERGSERIDGAWNADKDKRMMSLLVKLLDTCFRVPAEVVVVTEPDQTMLTVDAKGKLSFEAVDALHTIMRAVGRNCGRKITVNARGDKTSGPGL